MAEDFSSPLQRRYILQNSQERFAELMSAPSVLKAIHEVIFLHILLVSLLTITTPVYHMIYQIRYIYEILGLKVKRKQCKYRVEYCNQPW